MQFSVEVLGATFSVNLEDSVPTDVQREIAAQWTHLRVDDGRPEDDVLWMPGPPAPSSSDPDATAAYAAALAQIPDDLASRLTHSGLRARYGKVFLLHAAGLATDDGSVVALIGPSGRGKTTASRVLGQTMRYVSDETVAFDFDGSVIRYPKPLSIGRRPGPKSLLTPADAGMTVAEGPLQLAALVLLEREPERTDVVIEPVGFAEAAAEIAPQSSSMAAIPSALRRLAALVTRTGGVRRVRYGEAEALPGAIETILTTRSPLHEDIAAVEVEQPETSDSHGILRAPFADAVSVDDHLVVLGSRELHVLDGLGPAVWRAADGTSPDELHARVLDLVGVPPEGVDADAAIDDAVARLTQVGMLHRGA